MIVVPLPKDQPINFLDLATGEGIWVIKEAGNYPNATLIRTDIEVASFNGHIDLPDQISSRRQPVLDLWPETDHDKFNLVYQRAKRNLPEGGYESAGASETCRLHLTRRRQSHGLRTRGEWPWHNGNDRIHGLVLRLRKYRSFLWASLKG